jgi:hypothetical protein
MRRMSRAFALALVAVLGSASLARADAPAPFDPFDVRTVPAARGPSKLDPPPPRTMKIVEDPGRTRRNAGLWTAFAGGALVATSFALSSVAATRFDAAVARGDVDAANDALGISRNAGTSLFFGGIAALGVGAWLYFSAPSARERTVIVAPAAGPDQLGVALGGGF